MGVLYPGVELANHSSGVRSAFAERQLPRLPEDLLYCVYCGKPLRRVHAPTRYFDQRTGQRVMEHRFECTGYSRWRFWEMHEDGLDMQAEHGGPPRVDPVRKSR